MTTTNAITAKSDINQVSGFLRQMLKEGRDEDAINLVVELLEAVRTKNTELELKVQKLLRQHYGRKSEGVSSAQLSLFLKQLSTNEVAASVLLDDDDLVEQTEVKSHQRGKKVRRPLPVDLPKIQHEHQVEDEKRICQHCGTEMKPMGHDTRNILDFEPARFVLHEHLLEKIVCKNCQEGVVMAKGPGKVIDGGIPGAGLLAEIIVNKYRDALPLYRQIQRFGRHGVDFPMSTVVGWVAYIARELKPIADLLRKQVLYSYVMSTDATGMPVMDRLHPKGIRKGSLLCHIGDGGVGCAAGYSRVLFFAYAPDQAKNVPQAILKDREGYLVLDAAAIYNGLFDQPDSKAIEVGCMMHCRRYFHKAFDLGDLRAAIALKYIKLLYKIEKKAKCENMSFERLARMRKNKSKPLLDEFQRWIAETYNVEPPKTPMHKALTYAINQWQALNRFVEDGRLPIDNEEVERAIRTVTIGRKNYLQVGSDAGGERAAILYTIMGSCTLADVNPWEYLRDVLDKIANGWPNKRLDELLPANWKPPSTQSG
jgi:transposase